MMMFLLVGFVVVPLAAAVSVGVVGDFQVDVESYTHAMGYAGADLSVVRNYLNVTGGISSYHYRYNSCEKDTCSAFNFEAREWNTSYDTWGCAEYYHEQNFLGEFCGNDYLDT